MERREALKTVSLILGSAIIGSEAFLSGCANPKMAGKILNTGDLNLLNEIAETLLPETNTPGAKVINVAEFINTMVSHYYSTEEQLQFTNGLKEIESRSENSFGNRFIHLNANQKKDVLVTMEKDAKDFYEAKKEGHHYYIMIKQLSIWAYLSSEIVAKNAFIHLPVPGKFVGEIDYKPGEKIVYEDARSGASWNYATHSIRK